MISCQYGNLKRLLRVTSLIVAVLFTWNSVVWADGGSVIQSISGKNKIEPVQHLVNSKSLLDSITLPESIGQIKKSFQGSGDRIVIHIQDAHVNAQA